VKHEGAVLVKNWRNPYGFGASDFFF
jgi:hypothetical protein